MRPNLRKPMPQNALLELCGSHVIELQRRSKFLLLRFSAREGKASGNSGSQASRVLIHLGMTGVLRLADAGSELQDKASFMRWWPQHSKKHDHWCFLLEREGKHSALIYNDVRRFGILDIESEAIAVEAPPYFSNLGVEPLSEDFSPELLWQKSRGKSTELKAWLLQGKVVCGVGNIYCSEALFLARLHPERPASSLKKVECEALYGAVCRVLEEAIAAGGTTLKDFRNSEGKPGYFQQSLLVYGRDGQPCTVCGSLVLKLQQAQRSSFFCPKCQKKPKSRDKAKKA